MVIDAGQASQYTLSWSEFRQQLQWMKEARIKSTDFVDLEKHIRGQTSPPEVTITFDDGHRNDLEAATELAQLGYQGDDLRDTELLHRSQRLPETGGIRPAMSWDC